MRKLVPTFWVYLTVIVLFSVCSARAHFNLNQNVRVFHVVHGDEGMTILLRTPMAYAVADKVGPVGLDGRPEPAPFTRNTLEDGVLMHYVDPMAIARDPLGLGAIIRDDIVIQSGQTTYSGQVERVSVYPIGQEPGFATKDEAITLLASDSGRLKDNDRVYVGDAIVDVQVTFPEVSHAAYSLSILSNPGLPGQDQTANLILDYRGGTIRTYRTTGLLTLPIEISGTVTSAASTFIVEGIRHIVEGLDHVLFVLCMVLGALNLKALLARITGFTLGHSVTLIMGFFGFVPSAPWFIPAVETAIALTIILAAADAVFQRPDRAHSNLTAVGVTASVGLLHGFGFSFMLREILQVDANNVWQSLLAFNVGVEVGQLLIVALVWPAVVFLRSMPPVVWAAARGTTAVSISVIAAYWAAERFAGVVA